MRAKLPRGTVGMEACGGSPAWARHVREQGHAGKWMAPQDVTPYGKTNKKELRDAAAIAAAVTRRRRRLVPLKEGEPPARQAWHRVRARLLGARTALVNAIRGRLAE